MNARAEEIQNKVKKYIENSLEYFDLSGIVAGYYIADDSILPCANLDEEYAFGYSDYEEKKDLQTSDVFHFASVSKLFVATAVQILEANGKLSIDDSISSHLPYFKMADERYKDITIRQMLSHTAGMPDVNDYNWKNPKTDDDALRNYVMSKEVTEGTLLHAPGELTFIYSNMAYEVLGSLISEISGMTFEKFIAENIFIPLGMRDSTFLTFLRDSEKNRLASPHKKDATNHIKKLSIYPYNREHGPSSTLTSTIKDIKKWGKAHINYETPILEIDYEKAWTPVADIPNINEKIGLGWFIGNQHGYTVYGHEGSDDGFRSSFWICPELKLQIIVLSNLDKAPVKKINKRIFELLIDE